MSTHSSKANQRRVAFATVIGTTVEWYDFFIYATAAGLVFAQLFFEPAGSSIGLLLSFASVGISFLFRPLGAFLAGHYGDKIGRRAMLVLTLILMGAATTLIGFLPTYATAGIIAPVMLLLLRILQGISAGGEWGGAVLMAVEHAPSDRRGRAGAFPQLGVPLGLLLASGVTALMTGVISPGAAFLEWGWRVPFLLSIVLDRRRLLRTPRGGRIPRVSRKSLQPRSSRPRSRSWSCSGKPRTARDHRRPDLRRQQRRRLHGHRRLHPQLRHQPRRRSRTH